MINATIDVPTKVADQYNHRFPNTPESNAGANERAGFIDAPEINAFTKSTLSHSSKLNLFITFF